MTKKILKAAREKQHLLRWENNLNDSDFSSEEPEQKKPEKPKAERTNTKQKIKEHN